MTTATITLPNEITTIPEALAFWAAHLPDAPAVKVEGSRPITYRELLERAHAIASQVRSHGIARNDVVLVMTSNELDQAICLLGTTMAAIGFAVDADSPRAEFLALAERTGARAAIADSNLEGELRTLCDERGIHVLSEAIHHPTSARLVDILSDGASSHPRADDPAVISQSSGTTGRAKLIVRSHGHTIRSGKEHREVFGLSPADRALAVAPVSLPLGRVAFLYSIVSGGSIIFPRSRRPIEIWRAIARERPTWMHASAGFLELLAASEISNRAMDDPSLRFVRVTAAAVSPEVCERLEREFQAPVLPSYSSIETGFIATNLPDPDLRRRGSVGRPRQPLRIVDEHGHDVPEGGTGEIWVRGIKVVSGYLDDDLANDTAFTADGWFRTGDAGYLDEDGFLFLTGRLKELINRGGSKISPVEVDRVIAAHPDVAEAAAFAIPDDLLGEDIAIAVVLKSGASASARQLRSWMLDQLAIHKVPRRVWFLAPGDLPRTTSGKVQRIELARRWAANQPGGGDPAITRPK